MELQKEHVPMMWVLIVFAMAAFLWKCTPERAFRHWIAGFFVSGHQRRFLLPGPLFHHGVSSACDAGWSGTEFNDSAPSEVAMGHCRYGRSRTDLHSDVRKCSIRGEADLLFRYAA